MMENELQSLSLSLPKYVKTTTTNFDSLSSHFDVNIIRKNVPTRLISSAFKNSVSHKNRQWKNAFSVHKK